MMRDIALTFNHHEKFVNNLNKFRNASNKRLSDGDILGDY